MTVPASRRGKNRMEVFAKANELCAYTVEITANERTFKPWSESDARRFRAGH